MMRKLKFHKGEKVHGNYRSAKWNGTIVGLVKRGTKESTTEYIIKPMYRHISNNGNKEPETIHRYGNKIKKDWIKAGYPKTKK